MGEVCKVYDKGFTTGSDVGIEFRKGPVQHADEVGFDLRAFASDAVFHPQGYCVGSRRVIGVSRVPEGACLGIPKVPRPLSGRVC